MLPSLNDNMLRLAVMSTDPSTDFVNTTFLFVSDEYERFCPTLWYVCDNKELDDIKNIKTRADNM